MKAKRTCDSRVVAIALLAAGTVTGCTSLGHEQRAVPKLSRPIEAVQEFGLDSDDNELGLAVEKYLDARGIKATLLATPQVREKR